jgi:hypothetical protein
LIEFLRRTRDDDDTSDMADVILRELGGGLQKLEAITAFVTAARWRVASAAATVYPETPKRPPVDEAGSSR